MPLTGRRAIDFRLWDAREGGQEKCELMNPRDGYSLSADGRFSISLPESCVSAVSENPQLWVELRVLGTELPRAALGAVPYAVEARRASTADSASGALEQRIAALEARRTGEVAGIWFASNAGDTACAEITASTWVDVPSALVEFTVDRPIRIWSSYEINVQPSENPGGEALGTRLVIDDLPADASGSHFQPYTTLNPNAALTGSFVFDLEPGAHTVKLQWATSNGTSQTWSNCLGWTGGYGGGRTVTVIGVYR